jgi:hypothetical protein
MLMGPHLKKLKKRKEEPRLKFSKILKRNLQKQTKIIADDERATGKKIEKLEKKDRKFEKNIKKTITLIDFIFK